MSDTSMVMLIEAIDQASATLARIGAAGRAMGDEVRSGSAAGAQGATTLTAATDALATAQDRATKTAGYQATAYDYLARTQQVQADAARNAAASDVYLAQCANDVAAAETMVAERSDLAAAAQTKLVAAQKAVADSSLQAASAEKAQGDAATTAAAKTDAGSSSMRGAGIATVAVAAGLTMFAVSAVKAASTFQNEMELSVTQAGLTQKAVDAMGSRIIALGPQVNQTSEALAEAFYHVASVSTSMGLDAAHQYDLLKIAAEGAAIGHADLTATTNALIDTVTSKIGGVKNYSDAMGQLNAIVGSGNMTMQDLVSSFSTGTVGAAGAFGVSLSSLGAALSALTDTGLPATQAMTRLRMMMTLMADPSKQAAGILNELGVSQSDVATTSDAMTAALKKSGVTHSQLAADMQKPDGIVVALTDLRDHLEAAGVSAQDASAIIAKSLGGARSGSTALQLEQILAQIPAKFDQITSSGNNMGDAWAKTQQTAAFQAQKLKDSFDAIKVAIGVALLPMIQKLLDVVLKIVTPITAWVTQHKTLAAAMVLAGIALGALTILVWAMFAAVTALTLPMMAVVAVIAVFAVAGYEIITHWTAVKAFLARWWPEILVLFTGGAGLIVALIVKNWSTISEWTVRIWNDIYSVLQSIWHGLVDLWNNYGVPLVQFIKDTWDSISEAVSKEWAKIYGDLQDIWSKLVQLWDTYGKPIVTVITDAFKWLEQWLHDHWDAIKQVATDEWNAIYTVLKTAWDIISAMVKTAIDVVTAIIKTAWDAIAAIVKIAWDVISGIINIALDLIKGVINIFVDFVTGHWGALWNDVKTLAQNLWNDIYSTISGIVSAISNFLIQIWNNIYSMISGVLQNIWGVIQSVFNTVWNFLSGIWNNIKSAAQAAWDWLYNTISGAVTKIKNGVTSIFTDMKNTLSSIWDGIKSVVQKPISFVVNSVLNPLIGGWDKIADFIGFGHIDKIQGFASGGVLPGYAPGQDSIPAMLSPGEGILTPQAVRAIGGANAIHALNGGASSDGYHFAQGGIATDWWNPIDVANATVSDALGALKSGVSTVGHFVRGVAGTAATALLYPIHGIINTLGQTGIPGTLRKGANQELDKVISWIKGYDDKNGQSADTGGGSIPFTGSGNVASWIMQALQLAGVPIGYAGDVAAIIQFESGGNPNAINLTDSNAIAGHPSKGLMQTIPSTFEAYRLQSLPDNIYDPVANIVAGIRYAISRYGSLDNVPGVRAVNSGGSYVGYESGTMDTGPNAGLAMLHPREAVLPANIASKFRSGGFGGGVTININNPTVRNDKDIDEIARKVEAVIVQQWLPNAGIQARI